MEIEYEYFLELLSDYINKQKSTAPQVPVDWAKLVKLSKMHELSGVLYYQDKECIPADNSEEIALFFRSTIYHYQNRLTIEKQIMKKFSEENISAFIIKGSMVAQYYPVPALRTMGDTDIVIHTEDRQRVHALLIDNGFVCKSMGSSYTKNGMLFEIHDHLTHETIINSDEIVAFFNDYWGYVRSGKIDWSFHFLFLLLHFRAHFFGSGIGLRHFLDIAVVTKYNTEIDWSFVEQKLKTLGMWNFAEKVFSLNDRWFSVQAPIDIEPIEESLYEAATVQILRSGVFGNGDCENKSNRIATYCPPNEPYSLYMIKQSCGMVFIKYKHMIRMPQYAFLKGRPYLLLIAWAYRGFLTIKSIGMKRVFKKLKSPFVNRSLITKRKEYLDQWR